MDKYQDKEASMDDYSHEKKLKADGRYEAATGKTAAAKDDFDHAHALKKDDHDDAVSRKEGGSFLSKHWGNNSLEPSPFKDKGHPGDEKTGHGHKGRSYKKGDALDEDVSDDYSDFNVGDLSAVQEDEEGQYITTLDAREYPDKTGKNNILKDGPMGRNTKRDTIRSNGPKFKRRY